SAPGIDELVAHGSPVPSFDVHAPLLSLPGILRTTLDTIPATVPYLRADPELVEQWGRELQPLRGLKVGIAWQGNPAHAGDRKRSVPLSQFAPLTQLEGVELVSLQVGPGAQQLQRAEQRELPAAAFHVTDLGSHF